MVSTDIEIVIYIRLFYFSIIGIILYSINVNLLWSSITCKSRSSNDKISEVVVNYSFDEA